MYDCMLRPEQYSERMKQFPPYEMRVKSFDVKIDANGAPVLGLGVDPEHCPPFIIPVAFESAKALANMILQALMFESPEMFFPEEVAKKFRSGQLSLEQLKDLV